MTSYGNSEKPRIILIHPQLDFWDYLRSAPSLPLNLLHASAMAATDYDVRILDIRVTKRWREKLRGLLDETALLVGVTTMVGEQISSALEAAELVKSISGIPVVFGGPQPGVVVEASLKEPSVDYVVQGEGEHALCSLARALREGASCDDIPGVWSRKGNGVSGTPGEKKDVVELEEMPHLPYELVDVRQYIQFFKGAGYLPMETSRGCPCKCRHCYNSAARWGWRPQSAGRVMERAARLKQISGADGIYFVDDNFFVDRERAVEIGEGLKNAGLLWQVQGIDIETLRDLDDECFSALCETGLTRITVGIESGSDAIRKRLNKRPDIDSVMDVVKWLKKYPVIVYCSFITNFPGETVDDLKKTVDTIVALADLNPNFRTSPIYQYVPFPGTPMFNDAVKDGFSPPDTLSGWAEVSYENGYGKDNLGTGDKFYSGLYFTTLFCDGKYNEYISRPLIRFLSRAYRAVAIFRLRRLMLRFIPEMFVFRILKVLARVLR